MTNRLQNKIAVVTGATSGIGLATAKLFAVEGARVYITGRRKDALDKAVAEIGHGAVGVQADSASNENLDKLFAQVKAEQGRLDALVVNAGGGSMLPLGQITEEQIDHTFGRNVKAVIFTVQKALPLMGKGASIVLTGSTAGTEGTAAFSVYSASKAAVRNLARSWALDLKGTGIRVNVVSPGATRVCALESSASTHHVLGTLENADRITAKPEVCDALPAISSHPRCDVQRKPRCARSSPYFWHGTAAHSRIGWPSVNSTNPGFAVPAPSKA